MNVVKIIATIFLLFFGAAFVGTAYNEYCKRAQVSNVVLGFLIGIASFLFVLFLWTAPL